MVIVNPGWLPQAKMSFCVSPAYSATMRHSSLLNHGMLSSHSSLADSRCQASKKDTRHTTAKEKTMSERNSFPYHVGHDCHELLLSTVSPLPFFKAKPDSTAHMQPNRAILVMPRVAKR